MPFRTTPSNATPERTLPASSVNGAASAADVGRAPTGGVFAERGRAVWRRRWLPDLVSACIVLALAALVAVPLLIDRYTRQFRYEMRDVAEPARGFVTDVQLALALQGSALHDYVQARDSLALVRYRQALDQERTAYARLTPLTERLGSMSAQRFTELRSLEAEWHAGVERFLAGRPLARDRADPVQEDLYDDVLLAAARLDEVITVAAEERRRRITSAELVERRLSVLLGLVAAAAAFLTAWLARRLHAYAGELRLRGIELEQVMESRARLMRGLSHDLKNPLNAIDGHAQLLQDGVRGPMTEPQRQSAERIRRSVRALLGLITDLLELSRAEAGHLSIDLRPADVVTLVRDAAEEQRAAAEAAGHTLEVDVPAELLVITTDAGRVQQILGNLLSNAVKYTPSPGRIAVRAGMRRSQGGPRSGAWLAIEVTDSGPGIPADEVARIFDEFARLTPEAAPGAGLGLAISRRIARLLGGDITVASEVGRGSTFTLWLPANRREERSGRRPSATASASA